MSIRRGRVERWRELRDQAASARELTHAFGKRGGEHTR
jgi:DNA mismatch repair protein MutH